MMDALIDRLITLGGKSPRAVAKTVFCLILGLYATSRFSQSVYRHGVKRTLFYGAFLIWKSFKGDSGYKGEMKKVRNDFRHSMYHEAVKNTLINKTLPTKSLPSSEIISKLKKWSGYEEELWNGKKKMSSGAVYHGGKELTKLQNDAYSLYSISNPLHPDVFPFTRKLESEIIAMTISYFNGNPYKQRGILFLLFSLILIIFLLNFVLMIDEKVW